MSKKRIVLALGHNALGTNLPEQKAAVGPTARMIADFIQNGWQVAVVHSNAPQVGMIHRSLPLHQLIKINFFLILQGFPCFFYCFGV